MNYTIRYIVILKPRPLEGPGPRLGSTAMKEHRTVAVREFLGVTRRLPPTTQGLCVQGGGVQLSRLCVFVVRERVMTPPTLNLHHAQPGYRTSPVSIDRAPRRL